MRTLVEILPYIQISFATILVALILLQHSEADIGGSFGGSDGVNAARTRRGAERVIFNSTILIAILFVASVFIAIIIK